MQKTASTRELNELGWTSTRELNELGGTSTRAQRARMDAEKRIAPFFLPTNRANLTPRSQGITLNRFPQSTCNLNENSFLESKLIWLRACLRLPLSASLLSLRMKCRRFLVEFSCTCNSTCETKIHSDSQDTRKVLGSNQRIH